MSDELAVIEAEPIKAVIEVPIKARRIELPMTVQEPNEWVVRIRAEMDEGTTKAPTSPRRSSRSVWRGSSGWWRNGVE